MAGARNWTVRQQRNDACLRHRNRFIEKLFAIAHRRVLPIPVTPDDRGEWPAAFWHDEICRHDAAFRTIVSNVVNSRICSWLHTDLFNSERRLSIVIEMANQIGILGTRVCGAEKKNCNERKKQ